MKPPILSIFLLSILLSIAAALKCYYCYEKNSDACQQGVIECPEGDRCITVSEEYSYGGKYHSIYKGCLGNKTCDVKTYGKASNNEYYMVSTKCCNEDFCNYKFFEMPEDGEPRGSLCPACFWSNTTEECKATEELKCLKKEDECLHFIGKIRKPDEAVVTYSIKGCISPQECKKNLSQAIGIKVLYVNIFECNPPKPQREEQKLKQKY